MRRRSCRRCLGDAHAGQRHHSARQNSSEFGATICMADMSGPFDHHLTHYLIRLCQEFQIPYQRDVFRFYRSDSAAAVEAGADPRTALATFGIDASHGWERDSLERARIFRTQLVTVYAGPTAVSARPGRHRPAHRLPDAAGVNRARLSIARKPHSGKSCPARRTSPRSAGGRCSASHVAVDPCDGLAVTQQHAAAAVTDTVGVTVTGDYRPVNRADAARSSR